jgi:hypothetical protein
MGSLNGESLFKKLSSQVPKETKDNLDKIKKRVKLYRPSFYDVKRIKPINLPLSTFLKCLYVAGEPIRKGLVF